MDFCRACLHPLNCRKVRRDGIHFKAFRVRDEERRLVLTPAATGGSSHGFPYQLDRVLSVNDAQAVSVAIFEAVRDSLVIGQAQMSPRYERYAQKLCK